MGNNPSNNTQQGTRSDNAKHTGSKGSSLHPYAHKRLQAWLDSIPFALDETQTHGIYEAVTYLEVDTPQRLVSKGSDPIGIYVVLSGDVEALSGGDNDYVIRIIQEGECFGEISVLYETTCTADIHVPTKASFLLLKTDDARRLFTLPPQISMLDWCSRRKYIDTSGLFSGRRLCTNIALAALRQVPVLHGWEDVAFKELVESIKQDVIVLYPSGSVVYREGDSGQEIYILVDGRVEFSTGDQKLAVFDAKEREFSFGEEGFFSSSTKRSTVRALTPSQVIVLKKENFYDVLNKHPAERVLLQVFNEKWKEHMTKRDEELYSKYGGALDLEILRMALKQSEFFKECPSGFLYMVALAMVVKEIREEQAILSHAQYNKGGTLFLLLQGSAVVTEEQDDVFDTIDVKQVFSKLREYPTKAWVKASQLSVVAYFNMSNITEANSAYPEVKLPDIE